MSDNQSQTQSRVMERIAFCAVIVFALGISYAIYVTQQTVNAVQESHYQNTQVVSVEDATSSEADNSQYQTTSSGE